MTADVFHQVLDPAHSTLGSTLLALVPAVVLLLLLAAFRMSAWKAAIIASVVTLVEAMTLWQAPVGHTFAAYGLGAATGVWSVDWIVLWGVVIYNTMVVTGAFEAFKRWLVTHATADIRVQTLLMAWAFGALMEGLVGFGYPWAVVAPLLIGFGMADLAAIRVAALANNAPVSFGALGAPIIGLAAVTGLPLMSLSAAVGKIVAVLALAPPWLLIYLVSGKRGFRDGWPLAVVGSLAYILGQYPTSQWLGPYLPDVIGSLVCFGALLVLLRYWRPKSILGFGGTPLTEEQIREHERGLAGEPPSGESPSGESPSGEPASAGPGAARAGAPVRQAWRGLVPFGILVAVVVAWTGPWSPLPKYVPFAPHVDAVSSLSGKVSKASWSFAPFVAGTAILVCWIIIAAFLRPNAAELRQVARNTFRQMWGALLVGPIVFGLAYVYNFSGMGNSVAHGFAQAGSAFIIVSPLLGWVAVALSGSNTSANALFGGLQYSVANLLHAPVLLFPSLNSLGAEVGKPVAPQTASVGVATTRLVRSEGQVIRYNLGWTLAVLAYLVLIGLLFYYVLPGTMRV
jgi:lactate permease